MDSPWKKTFGNMGIHVIFKQSRGGFWGVKEARQGKRWFKTKINFPNIKHFPKLDLMGNDREYMTTEYDETQEEKQEQEKEDGSSEKSKRKKSDSSQEGKTPRKRIILKIGGKIFKEINRAEDQQTTPSTSTSNDKKRKDSDKEK